MRRSLRHDVTTRVVSDIKFLIRNQERELLVIAIELRTGLLIERGGHLEGLIVCRIGGHCDGVSQQPTRIEAVLVNGADIFDPRLSRQHRADVMRTVAEIWSETPGQPDRRNNDGTDRRDPAAMMCSSFPHVSNLSVSHSLPRSQRVPVSTLIARGGIEK